MQYTEVNIQPIDELPLYCMNDQTELIEDTCLGGFGKLLICPLCLRYYEWVSEHDLLMPVQSRAVWLGDRYEW